MTDVDDLSYVQIDVPHGYAHVYSCEQPALDGGDTALSLQLWEQERANRFTNPADKNKYTGAHVLLRHVLSRYVGKPPERITIDQTELGKPVLTGAHTGVHFSLSYRATQVLVGVSDQLIGVDLEQVSKVDADSLAGNFFSAEECRLLSSTTDEQEKQTLFFRMWTLKEAFIKGMGMGVGYDLQSFSVLPGKTSLRANLRSVEERWFVTEIEMPAGYKGAVAVQCL